MITSQLTHFDKSNRWKISVKDTGIGIDSNHIDDIFNPFFQVDSSQTRQYEGSGVGLPVVKQLVQLMGRPSKLIVPWDQGRSLR
ncbi:ATP-binding protein [Psychrobacter sp. KH172YL61]|uniref:ATP-binding protein n=1 Tax=Psychrobacter sp. KH172YL61 TaxID=2517899 RepID=UPI001F086D61|nr:ATP-binding protein [Psychrobacter sp. KH172YL61]